MQDQVKGPFEFNDSKELRVCLHRLGVDMSDCAANFVFVMGTRAVGTQYNTGAMNRCFVATTSSVLTISSTSDEPASMEDPFFENSVAFPRVLLDALGPVSSAELQAEEDCGKRTLRITEDFSDVLRTLSHAMLPGVLMLTPKVFRSPRQLHEHMTCVGGVPATEFTQALAIKFFHLLLLQMKTTYATDRLPMISVNIHAESVVFVNTRRTGSKTIVVSRPDFAVQTGLNENDPEIRKRIEYGQKVARSAMSVPRA